MDWAVLAASLIGGIVSLYFFEGKEKQYGTNEPITIKTVALVVVGGTAMGYFLGGGVLQGLELKGTSAKMEAGASLIIAMVGMSAVAKIVKIDWRGIAESWLKRKES